MNKTPLLTGLGGFALGCLTVFLYQKPDTPTASPVASAVVAEKVHESTPNAKVEPAKVTQNSVAPEVKVISSGSALDPKVQEVMKGVRESMQKRNEERLNARVDERLASLKTKLGLSDEQLEAMRPLVGKMLTDGGNEMIFSGANGSFSVEAMQEKRKELAAAKAAAEAALIASLNPSQRAAYDAWKSEESANKIEGRANSELASLQSQLSLSPEQKDLAFAAFSKLASESSSSENALDNPMGFIAARKAKLEALRPILTPEQLSVYEKTASSNVMHFSSGETGVMELENGGEAVISTVLSIGSDSATVAPETKDK